MANRHLRFASGVLLALLCTVGAAQAQSDAVDAFVQNTVQDVQRQDIPQPQQDPIGRPFGIEPAAVFSQNLQGLIEVPTLETTPQRDLDGPDQIMTLDLGDQDSLAPELAPASTIPVTASARRAPERLIRPGLGWSVGIFR